jgi:hypothetical protein
MPALPLKLLTCACIAASARPDTCSSQGDEEAALLQVPPRRPLSATEELGDDLAGVEFECVSSYNWNAGNPDVYVFAPVASPENPNSYCEGGYETSGTQLTMYGDVQPRMFFKKADGGVLMIDMTRDTVGFWIDLSDLGAGYNGALYTAWTPFAESARLASGRYCDANDGTGNGLWCPEMDIFEGNSCGMAFTSHACTSNRSWPMWCNMDANTDFPGFCGDMTCDRAGVQGSHNAEDAEYGFGPEYEIDTSRPFHVAMSFSYVDGQLVAYNTTVAQPDAMTEETRILTKSVDTMAPELYPDGFPTDGKIGLLAQLWNTSTEAAMSWLAGPNCTRNSSDDPSEITVKMWDISINGKPIKFKNVSRKLL